MDKKLISIVIPFLNEKESLDVLFDKIKNQIDWTKDYSFELVFVDDWSKDGSLESIKNIYITFSDSYVIKIISFAKNSWKTNALKTAFENVNWDYVVTMDADLQDDPKYLLDFVKTLEDKQLDMVVWFRKNRYKTNFIKLISSKSANAIVNFFFKNSVSDMNCWYKIMRKEVTQDLLMKSDYHRFIPVMALAAGYKVWEMEIKQYDRVYGESKYGKTWLSRWVKSLFDLITLIFILKFQFNPFHFFGKYGIYLTLIGTIILAYLSVKWMLGFPIQSRPLFFLWILSVMVWINFLWLWLLWELISKNSIASHNLIIKEKIWI